MNAFDPAGQEFLRISERYRQMSDEELLVLMPQSSELTLFAQQALANEVRSRGLKVEAEPAAPPPVDPPPVNDPQFDAQQLPPPAFFGRDSPVLRGFAAGEFLSPASSYDEDRKLIELCKVWSQGDALKVQAILDGAGIPFFMGSEKAMGVDRVTSNFADGVSVQIMQVGLPWARSGMQHYEPEDDPTPKGSGEAEQLTVRCPKCHSEEVVFEGLSTAPGGAGDESSQEFDWSCDACGNRWEDDGVAKE